MAFSEYDKYDGLGLAELVKSKEVKPSEVLEAAIGRAEALNPKLNFFTYKAYDEGRRMAEDAGLPDGPFKGVPWMVKELATPWEGLPMTSACPYFKDFVATFDSEMVRRVKQAGFVLLGKSNAPQAGWALSSESEMYGPCRNPWDLERTSGGSSGGAASAVAARVLPISEASDGGGSTRGPASICGVVGLKPGRGRGTLAPVMVDLWYGGVLFCCVSRSVRDTAAYLDVAGANLPGEPYYAPAPARPYLEEVGADPGKLRIAMVSESPEGCTPLDDEVKASVAETAKLLESLGHSVEPQPLPYDFWPLFNTYMDIIAVQMAGWFGGMAQYIGREATRHDMEPLYWTMIRKGKTFSGVQHSNDVERLRMMCRDIVGKMAAYDAWLMPTLPMTPRKLGYYDMSLDVDTYNETLMGPDCAFTAPFNATGSPAISLPLHWTKDGLPVGVQFVGRDCDEAGMIRLAAQLEQAKPWADKVPPVAVG